MGQVKAIGGDPSKIAASISAYSGAGAGGKFKSNRTLSSPKPQNHSASGGQAGIAGTPNGSSGGVIN